MRTKRPTILAVDDTPANLVALEAVLDRDFELVFADSGPSAIEILSRRTDIAVVLLDVQMPAMDGFETAERIKKLPGCRNVPIVFITAVFHEDPYVKRGYQVGGVDYFTKPFDPELLRLKMAIYASFREKGALLDQREQHIRETEELLEASRKLSTMLESVPVGILVVDLDGRICQSNDELARIVGLEEVIGHGECGKVLGWWGPDGTLIADRQGPLARALLDGVSVHDRPMQIQCVDGAAKAVSVSTSPLLGTGGTIGGAVVVMKDTSASKQLEAELESRVARFLSLGVELEQPAHA